MMKRKLCVIAIVTILFVGFGASKNKLIKDAFADILPVYCIGDACPFEYSEIYECLITHRNGTGMYGRLECCKTVT